MSARAERLSCPLCGSFETTLYANDRRRMYHHCPACDLVFVPPSFHLSLDQERKRYDLHRNSLQDAGYRAFLERLFLPLQKHLRPSSAGLDFGSGPEPALAVLFRDAGHRVELFDPFYAPEPAVFGRDYDFVTACEVVEHLRDPAGALERLWGCLRPGGWLGIMTRLVVPRTAFTDWHYKNDPTHICFYSAETFTWLARLWDADLELSGDDVFLLRKR